MTVYVIMALRLVRSFLLLIALVSLHQIPCKVSYPQWVLLLKSYQEAETGQCILKGHWTTSASSPDFCPKKKKKKKKMERYLYH